MTVINTNVSALNARAAMATNARSLDQVMGQLSTGRRINAASDDAAGLAIAAKMTSQIRGLNQAVRNANDAITMLQTAEGATNEITNMLQRMRELAVQASNDTYSSDDRTALDSEFSALRTEIARVASTTKWNDIGVLDGSAGTSGTVKFQIGAVGGGDNSLTFTFGNFNSANVMSNISAAGISTQASAASAIGFASSAIAAVNSKRSDMGAVINRLQYTIDNLTNISTNSAASRSRIEDADYSAATTELARRQVIQQAATAMLAQANQQPQVVLTLLK
jgi:flagellin